MGGSAECLRVVTEGHAEVGKLLRSRDGREKLADMFNVCHGMVLMQRWNLVFIVLMIKLACTGLLFADMQRSCRSVHRFVQPAPGSALARKIIQATRLNSGRESEGCIGHSQPLGKFREFYLSNTPRALFAHSCD